MNNKNFRLDPKSDLGIVTLNVANLQNLKDFYTNVVFLEILEEKDNYVILGLNDVRILKLQEKKLDFPKQTDAGLYHNAIVFKNEAMLANVLENILIKSPQSYQGSGDHFVSQAFYFSDPEENGLELYVDRPNEIWQWNDGFIQMGSEYIDIQEFITRYALSDKQQAVREKKAKMGHIHLKVGNIPKAKQFYVDVLGLDVTAELPSALFLSVGGYHHHIGMNTWQSLNANKRENTLGLESFEISTSSENEFHKLKTQLENKSIKFKEIENKLEVYDPWNNLIKFHPIQNKVG